MVPVGGGREGRGSYLIFKANLTLAASTCSNKNYFLTPVPNFPDRKTDWSYGSNSYLAVSNTFLSDNFGKYLTITIFRSESVKNKFALYARREQQEVLMLTSPGCL